MSAEIFLLTMLLFILFIIRIIYRLNFRVSPQGLLRGSIYGKTDCDPLLLSLVYQWEYQ